MKNLLLLLLPCILWISVLLPSTTAADPEPCRFPKRCSCSLTTTRSLRCTTMEHCFNQNGMDAIASSIWPEICPVEKFIASCLQRPRWPILEITSQLFQHHQWRRLKELDFGSGCPLEFKERQVLSQLPNLRSLAMQSANISIDLTRFSDIICCPSGLSQLLLDHVAAEVGGTRFGNNSFIGLHALSRLTILFSPKLMDRIDLVLNTSSPSFLFHWHGNLKPENRNFSSLSITNLANRSSALELGLSGSKIIFNLDAPANIVGFSVSKLVLSDLRMAEIGDSPFRGFTLKDLSVTKCGLNDKLLPKLLSSISQNGNRTQVKTLTLQFKLKKRAFPFAEFNKLCGSMPYLRHLSIGHSTISFAEPERYLECSQLKMLSLTNCDLTDAELTTNAFSRLTNLNALDLQSNRLDTFPKEALRFISQLKYLDLSGNSKMDLRASSLQGILPELVTVKLSRIVFSEPLVDAFAGQPNLTELSLSGTRPIGHLECPFKKTWFRNCSKLRSLSLASDSFFGKAMCHADGFFDPLVSIEYLNLKNCGFGLQTSGIVKSLLAKLTSLTSLTLSSNSIRRLELIIKGRMPNLTFLDVSNNQFSSIPRDLLFNTAPRLRVLYLVKTPVVNIDPETFSRMPHLRIRLGGNQFACDCDLLPFTDWLRQQWPIYQMEARGDWLSEATCNTMSNETVRVLDFRMSWWDCYSRRLIVFLSSSIAALLLIFGIISLMVKYRWKLHYSLLVFYIRHHLVRRRIPSEWDYDGCFIYDETDSQVSRWVGDLVHKLESDLQLRLYEPERDAPAGANILDEAASAIDRSRHAVLVLTRGFLENRLNMYSAQWSNESFFMRRRSLAVMVMRERLSESELNVPGCEVLHRLHRMCKPDRIVDCSGCGVGGNSANRLGLLLYRGARIKGERHGGSDASETEPLMRND